MVRCLLSIGPVGKSGDLRAQGVVPRAPTLPPRAPCSLLQPRIRAAVSMAPPCSPATRAALLLVATCCLFSSAAAQSLAPGLDSRNVPQGHWICDGAVTISFGSTAVTCGTEIPAATAATQPTITMANADPMMNYTVLVLDRDARSMASPTLSPLAHFAVSKVNGTQLRAGFDATAASALTSTTWCESIMHFRVAPALRPSRSALGTSYGFPLPARLKASNGPAGDPRGTHVV